MFRLVVKHAETKKVAHSDNLFLLRSLSFAGMSLKEVIMH